MGIDPGLVATGYGCLERRECGVAVLDAGVIHTSPREPIESRLSTIHDAVRELLDTHRPTALVVEDLYAEYKFPRTAILMGHARGVVLLAGAERGVAMLSLAPAEIKRVVVANGAASKLQVQRGVQAMLGLPELPRPTHVADALSLALTGMSRMTGRL